MGSARTETNGLTAQQRQEFDTRGLVRLDAAIPRTDADAMADRLWEALARRHGLRKGAPETWATERPFGHQAVQASGAFAPMASPAVRAALDSLMGRDAWSPPEKWGQPLVCFPGAERAWSLPHQIWHLDGPAEPGDHIRLGRVFAILAPLEAGGGGTLMAEGSHRLVRTLAEQNGGALSSGDTRKRLKALHPWFRDLMSPGGDPSDRVSRFMEAQTFVGDIELRVTEMTGEPGDVWLMHPDVLHAPAPNVLGAPRLVVTQFVSPKP
jgi:hypothetical protein